MIYPNEDNYHHNHQMMNPERNIKLYTVNNLYKGSVIKRPSKYIKSPYVADVLLEDGEETIAHTASLGCCGMVEQGSIVYMTKNTNPKTKTKYGVILSQIKRENIDIIIGIHPKIAEEIAFEALKQKCIRGLNPKTIKREKTFLQSRFDFVGQEDNGTYYILEVKNVPLAMERTEPHTLLPSFTTTSTPIKVAYFPDGHRKNKNDTVSSRAVKHLYNLAEIKIKEPRIRTIILFIIQREDVVAFQPSPHDPVYTEALHNAHKNGVEIHTLQVTWNNMVNKCLFLSNNLPILI